MKESPEEAVHFEKEPILSFNAETATVLLDVHLDCEVPLWLKDRAQREGLSEKKEFHITIIGSKTGKALLSIMNGLGAEDRAHVLKEIHILASKFAWSFSPREEYYAISKEYLSDQSDGETEIRRSYIQLVDLPDLASFYEELNLMFAINSEVPFPHLTLFTSSTLEENELRGIGIYSEDQLKSLNPRRIAPETGQM